MTIPSLISKQEQLDIAKENLHKIDLPLKETATHLVYGKGNPDAPILFIGEAPGRKEDEQGVPFVGSAGKFLDELLQSIGLSLDKCYIANILKYRPPNNRDPNNEEILAHTPYLIEQINIIQPIIIATLGNYATKFILSQCKPEHMKTISGITKLHGSLEHLTYNDTTFKVVPLYHPAASLYNPRLKDVLFADFKKMKQLLEENVNQKTLTDL
jgi:DNA polymerase